MSKKLPLSPMLVQYLVGLCALKWDASAVNIEVTLGDMVPDEASGTSRDVDVTVTVDTPEGTYAFKGYEVKNWSTPLDVSDVEGLALKLKDMPSVTHRAIVSSSGFSGPAVKKAEHHGVDLFAIKPWTQPIEQQFPDLAPMSGSAAEVIKGVGYSLVWPQRAFWLDVPGAPPFDIPSEGKLFDANGKRHRAYKNFGAFADALVVRSTGILWRLKPISDRVGPLVEAHRAQTPVPNEPQWPSAHTLDVTGDEIFIRASDDALHPVASVTIYGELKWERMPMLHYAMEKVPTGEVFAGAVIFASDVPGRMWTLIFPANGRNVDVRYVQLEQKHLSKIEELKLAMPQQNSPTPTEG